MIEGRELSLRYFDVASEKTADDEDEEYWGNEDSNIAAPITISECPQLTLTLALALATECSPRNTTVRASCQRLMLLAKSMKPT